MYSCYSKNLSPVSRYFIQTACGVFFIITLGLLNACSSVGTAALHKKYAPEMLQHDVDVAWNTYKKIHPSYNWYASAEEVDRQFADVKKSITDSMGEAAFRLRLSKAVAAIHCGHTSVHPSKAYSNAARSARLPAFPFDVIAWGRDSVVVANVRSRKDTHLHRGDAIVSVNGRPVASILSEMKAHISSDGYNETFQEQIITANFGNRYAWHFGIDTQYTVVIKKYDSGLDTLRYVYTPPVKDTLRRDSGRTPTKLPRRPKRRRPSYFGSFETDSSGSFSVLNLPDFSHAKMHGLVRRSFRKLEEDKTPNLVIDLRGNTGGRMSRSAYLTRFVSDHRFRIADSVSAVSFRFPYTGRVQFGWAHRLFAPLLTHRDNDGRHHIRSVERKVYKPHRNAYGGNVYILTGGYTFSASLLFIAAVQQQQNVLLVGNETGGGLRGNSAVMTPYLTLPNTGVRLRLPLYRIVTKAALPHIGSGALPHVEVPFSSANIRNRADGKMETVRRLIKEHKDAAKN